MKICVIGLGGVGSWLVRGLAPLLAYGPQPAPELWLVDGDYYESRNRSRQAFEILGRKAEMQAEWVQGQFPRLSVLARSQYVSADGEGSTLAIGQLIGPGDIVLLGVDNHTTRHAVIAHCLKLPDVLLLAAGNDFTDGDCLVVQKRAGCLLTANPLENDTGLALPTDKSPHQKSCEELAQEGAPQLILANMQAAVTLLSLFYGWQQGWQLPDRVYFDLKKYRQEPRGRGPRGKKKQLAEALPAA